MADPRRGGRLPVRSSIAALLQTAAAQRMAGDKEGLVRTLDAAAELHRTGDAQIPRNPLYELCVLRFQAGHLAAAETRLRQGLQSAPGDFAMNNLLGVVLKNLGRYDEAVAALQVARAAEPANLSPIVNLGNLHIARRDGAAAAACFGQAVREQPGNAEYRRLLGVANRQLGNIEAALTQFAHARRIDARDHRNWIEPAGMFGEIGCHDEAVAMIEEGLASQPGSRPLCEAKFNLLRRAGRQAAVLAYGKELVTRLPDQAWVRIQLARSVMHADRLQANAHLREAVRLEPESPDAVAELADSLDRTRGKDEGENIASAYALALRRVALGGNMLPHARMITSILNRACNHAAADAVGSFQQLTRHWADTGYISALHYQMAQVRTPEDRVVLLEAHRKWGRTVDAAAARFPLPPPKPPALKLPAPELATPNVRSGRARLRLGLMSSDLRNHPVSYFTLPLIEGYDRERFELYCYSWNSGAGDQVQNRVAALTDGFRLAPAISDRDGAALIASDRLDMLIELGGTTYMNKLNVMAWRPAKVQASWLGYPHSAGPETIDYLLVDPYNRPTDDALLIEKPLVLPRSWVVLGTLGFSDRQPIEPGLPERRRGYLTFGTMNNPYKYTPEVLAAWARITAAADGAHFLFVRPEAATQAFQDNIRNAFAKHGVTAERVEFIGVRGTHMPHYNKIDIALDTFPQTGGTTTCEALWMGVPTVSLAGPCFFERLSLSNLTNAGLGDLAVPDRASYEAMALSLAADRDRRHQIRRTIRTEIRARPLGRIDAYVTDFQDTVRAAVEGATER